MRAKIIILILLIAAGMVSCRKDKPIPSPMENQDCYDFPVITGPQISWFTAGRFQYKTPYFNPSNSDEFVYYYRDFLLDENKLMKYNIQTGLKTELVNNVKLISQPKWSRKGWIAFDNTLDYQIWIVKDNGDSLTQFTTNTCNLYPAWNEAGNELLWNHTPVLGYPYFLVKQKLHSLIIDTLFNDFTKYNDISSDNKLISNITIDGQYHIGVSNVDQVTFNSLVNLSADSLDSFAGLSWGNNSQSAFFSIHYSNNIGGLFKIDLNSQSYEKIFEFCDSKQYSRISCSADGTNLIGERIDSYLPNPDYSAREIRQNSSIYIIDLLTLTETKIDLQ